MRLALLGDLMKERGRFEITDFWGAPRLGSPATARRSCSWLAAILPPYSYGSANENRPADRISSLCLCWSDCDAPWRPLNTRPAP